MQRPAVHRAMQSAFDTALLAAAFRQRQSRPVSWHPASAKHSSRSTVWQGTIPAPAFADYNTSYLPAPQLHSACLYDRGQPLSYSPVDITGPNQFMQTVPHPQDYPATQQSTALAMHNPLLEPNPWAANWPDLQASQQAIPRAWPVDATILEDSAVCGQIETPSYDSITSPSDSFDPMTPSFPPVQPLDGMQQQSTKLEDELVGMGLYSDPEVPGEHSPRTGRGLKLEETFIPCSDDEADDDGDDDNGSDVDGNDNDDGEGDDIDKGGQALEIDVPEAIVDGLEQTHMQKALSSKPCSETSLPSAFLLGIDDPSNNSSLFAGAQQLIASGSCMNYGYRWI